jgi:hypothetical protein
MRASQASGGGVKKELEQALIAKQPPKPDTYNIVIGLLLFGMTNPQVMNWSDWLCLVAGWWIILIYGYRIFKYRVWERKRDARSR